MGGIASRRCESCRKLVMVSDRGDVETVGAARPLTGQDDIDRAVCICGTVVSWPRRTRDPSPLSVGVLASAHPRNGSICEREGHDPMNGQLPMGDAGRLTTLQNICKRCSVFYALEVMV